MRARKKIIIKPSNWRIKALFIVFLFISFALIVRLYSLQIIQGDYYSALALGQKLSSEDENIPRGTIYFQDKAGSQRFIAATNRDTFLIYADPNKIEDEEFIFNSILNVIEFSQQEKEKILLRLKNKESSYALIAKDVSKEKVKLIKKLELDGVYIRNDIARYYPSGDLASHILGFLGFNEGGRKGQYGVEEYFNDILDNKESPLFILNRIFLKNTLEPTDIELTVDYGIQFMIEKKLNALRENLKAESASAIFMDPATGAILAMVSVPNFDLNEYSQVQDISIFGNLLVQSVFELGSIFKPITMAAAIDGGAITPQTVYVDKGSIRISGYTISNSDGKAYSNQTMTEVLEKSLNTGAMFAQTELGKKKFREYLKNFQLDKITNIDLPGEAEGSIDNILNTNIDINFATASFGQGISFSPMRFLTSISAIANGGVMMRPYILNKVIRGDEETITEPEISGTPISSTTASRVTAMMISVVDNGFGSKAAVPGYKIAGKTGTAQVPNENSPGYSDKTIHSFVGFAPAFNPKFVGIIMLKNPQGINFSADSVAPIFGEISSFILQYYKIPPQ